MTDYSLFTFSTPLLILGHPQPPTKIFSELKSPSLLSGPMMSFHTSDVSAHLSVLLSSVTLLWVTVRAADMGFENARINVSGLFCTIIPNFVTWPPMELTIWKNYPQ